jgi:nifR3 family TIM-barrel protein
MTDPLSKYLSQPLRIGSKTIKKRLVLAPMTFLGNVAYRDLISKYGGYGLTFSEMCSSKAIPQENRNVSAYFKWRNEESPWLILQIYGADPSTMALAARRVEEEGLFGVDINFGCANGSICRQNCGASILKDPDLAAKIVVGVRKAVSFPLTVKFRTGWKDDPQVAVDLAKRFENAGADALTFHPRVAPDRRSRPPKWEYIGMVKQAVNIPVFGNGNVFDRKDCWAMIRKTGCDGVAVGRMAIARPWIFSEWIANLKTDWEVFLDAAIQLANLLEKHYDPVRAIRRFKRFACYFSANFRFGHTLYSKILNAIDMREIETILYRFFQQPPDIVSRPNMNFFR